MKRVVIVIGVVILIAFALSLLGLWRSGMLYFRLSSATVAFNGAESAESTVYRAGNGDYLIFLDPVRTRHPVYKVTGDGRDIGIPAAPVPSSYTKSVKTGSFVLCLQCPITLAGTDKFDSKAQVSVTSSEIDFRVSDDAVNVKF